MASYCPNLSIYGNCIANGHTHQESINVFMKCANCQGQYQANYIKCPAFLKPCKEARYNLPIFIAVLLLFSPPDLLIICDNQKISDKLQNLQLNTNKFSNVLWRLLNNNTLLRYDFLVVTDPWVDWHSNNNPYSCPTFYSH